MRTVIALYQWYVYYTRLVKSIKIDRPTGYVIPQWSFSLQTSSEYDCNIIIISDDCYRVNNQSRGALYEHSLTRQLLNHPRTAITNSCYFKMLFVVNTFIFSRTVKRSNSICPLTLRVNNFAEIRKRYRNDAGRLLNRYIFPCNIGKI